MENRVIALAASTGDLKGRLKETVEHLHVATCADQHHAIAAKKLQEKALSAGERARGYMKWARQLKDKPGKFKMPEDPYIGREPVEAHIRRKVREGERKLWEKEVEYKAWLERMERANQERVEEQLQQKLAKDAEYAEANEAAMREREEQFGEQREEWVAASKEYWKWLQKTKEDIDRRPMSVPPPQDSGVESVESLVQRKVEAATQADQQRKAEYRRWVKSVSKAKMKLPNEEVLTPEEREQKIAELAKKRSQKSAKTASEYKKLVVELQQKHHERMLSNVRETAAVERRYRHLREENAAALQDHTAKAAAEKEKVAAQHRQFVSELKVRVRAQPFMVEEAYMPAVAAKVAHHRRPLSAPAGRRR